MHQLYWKKEAKDELELPYGIYLVSKRACMKTVTCSWSEHAEQYPQQSSRRGAEADVSPPVPLSNSARNYNNRKVNIDRRFEDIMLVGCSDQLRVHLNLHVCINDPPVLYRWKSVFLLWVLQWRRGTLKQQTLQTAGIDLIRQRKLSRGSRIKLWASELLFYWRSSLAWNKWYGGQPERTKT